MYLVIHILKVETEVARLRKLDYIKLGEKSYGGRSKKSNWRIISNPFILRFKGKLQSPEFKTEYLVVLLESYNILIICHSGTMVEYLPFRILLEYLPYRILFILIIWRSILQPSFDQSFTQMKGDSDINKLDDVPDS